MGSCAPGPRRPTSRAPSRSPRRCGRRWPSCWARTGRRRVGEGERELDLRDFELAEIDELAPDTGEYEQLLAARGRMRSIDGLLGAAAGAEQQLAGEAAGGGESGAAQLAARAAAALE